MEKTNTTVSQEQTGNNVVEKAKESPSRRREKECMEYESRNTQRMLSRFEWWIFDLVC